MPGAPFAALFLTTALSTMALPAAADDRSELAQVLDPLTVTASRTSLHSTAEAPASVTVIDAREAVARGATNILDAVRGVPGVTLKGRGVGGRKTFSIRGAEGKHTLVLIDGKRVAATDDVVGHSDYQYDWIPLDAVDRIEVVRGPMSALYGSEAVGGVVNIITKKAAKQWTGGATARGDHVFDDGGNSRQFAGSVRGPIGERVTLSAFAEDYRQADTPLKEDPLLSEIEGRQRRTGMLGLTVEPFDGHTVDLNVLESFEERWRDNLSTSGGRRTYYRDEYELRRRQRSVGYAGDWGPARTELRYTAVEFDVSNERSRGVTPTRPQNLKDRILDGTVAVPLFDSHLLTVGAEHRKETLTNAGLAGGSDSALHRAVYAQDEIALTDALTLTLGARLDDHEMFGSEWSPRAYLVWRAMPSLVIKGGYGEAFRAPTLKQISPGYVASEGPHTFYGNANVKPETSRSWEIGFDWTQGGTSVSGAVFTTSIENLIETRLIRSVGTRREYIYDNVSEARIRGGELAGRRELGAGFALAGSYTYLYATNEDTGATLADRPRHSLTGTLSWADGPWSLGLTAEHIGRQYIEATAGPEKAPSYTLWHLAGSYQVNDNVRVRAGLRNIGDVRLAEESPLFGYSEQGRTVYVALGASF